MSKVELDDIVFHHGAVLAADHVSLRLEDGEFFALLGPSGSGKTTILRLIAGFLTPKQGTIRIGDNEIQDMPAHRRNIGMVFQNYALFPHMSVEQNIAFGLKSRSTPRSVIEARVKEVVDLVQLSGLERRKPSQLSGGQQQRVALARALVIEPSVLLLDEPLASLDRKLRGEMQVELRRIQQRSGITTIFVTHDQEEAMTLADRIAVLRGGRIEQLGAPRDVYEYPKTRFVAEFLGDSNVLTGTVSSVEDTHLCFETRSGLELKAALPSSSQDRTSLNIAKGQKVTALVRPERVEVQVDPDELLYFNQTQAYISHISYSGSSVKYHLETESNESFLAFEQGGRHTKAPKLGQQVRITWSPEHTRLLQE